MAVDGSWLIPPLKGGWLLLSHKYLFARVDLAVSINDEM